MADRLATVGTLSAGVAHEINNPLAYTIANLSYVRDALAKVSEAPAGLDLTEVRASTEEAIEGAERVRRIVKDMKTLSRMDDERVGPVDVEAALEASVNMVAHELRQRAHVIKNFGRVPLVRGNEGRLVQVFLNLLVNAAQAIAGNAPDRNEVRLGTSIDTAGRVIVDISDTGVGIPDEVLPRIFDPFFTTKPVGVGTGLGLSICHSLITAMGGSIEVTSKMGVGTRFVILLPAADPVAAVLRAAGQA
jgi:signal transduction histidine kinase